MKRKVWLLLISTLIFAFSLPAKEKVKIGVVDLQRILMESTAGKKAKKELNDFYEQKKKELAKKEEELNKLKDDIDKKIPLLDEKTKREKQMEFENKRLEFLQDAQESEKLLKEKDAELTQSIIKDVQEIVDDIADSEGYTFIFEKNEGGLLYFDKLTDITDQVLKKYEAKTRK
jgi:outer membrane protein